MAYWRWDNYQYDLNQGAGFHFNSNQSRLHSEIAIGERLWLVTGRPSPTGSCYQLVAKLTITAKTFNSPGYKYGYYRLWGDIHNSQYYSTDSPALNDLLIMLKFATGKQISSQAYIGQALQTIRVLTLEDTGLLVSFSAELALEPRAYQLADEVALETSLERGEKAVHEVVSHYHAGTSDLRRSALRNLYSRNRVLATELQGFYQGRCQLCGFDPQLLYGVNACSAHHIIYLSRGGQDELQNMLLVCPNHHQIIHAANAAFDFKDLHYIFNNGRREPLVLNRHLP